MNLYYRAYHRVVLGAQKHFWKVLLPCWGPHHTERREQFQKIKCISVGFTLLPHFFEGGAVHLFLEWYF